MKVKLFKFVFVIVIAMIAGINVYNAQKPEPMSDIAMANVEALAENEGGELSPGPYDIMEDITEHFFNEKLYKKSKIVRCYPGGSYACQEGKYYKFLMDSGVWSDWIPD